MTLAIRQFICGLLTAVGVQAADISIAFDRSSTVGVTNYVVYTTNSANVVTRLNLSTNTFICMTGFAPGKYTFAVTAQAIAGVESESSNALSVEVAAAPANVRSVVLQYGATVTNFNGAAFFKVRIE